MERWLLLQSLFLIIFSVNHPSAPFFKYLFYSFICCAEFWLYTGIFHLCCGIQDLLVVGSLTLLPLGSPVLIPSSEMDDKSQISLTCPWVLHSGGTPFANRIWFSPVHLSCVSLIIRPVKDPRRKKANFSHLCLSKPKENWKLLTSFWEGKSPGFSMTYRCKCGNTTICIPSSLRVTLFSHIFHSIHPLTSGKAHALLYLIVPLC